MCWSEQASIHTLIVRLYCTALNVILHQFILVYRCLATWQSLIFKVFVFFHLMALLLSNGNKMWRKSAAQPSKSDFAVKSCFHQNQFDTCSVTTLYVAYVWIRIITVCMFEKQQKVCFTSSCLIKWCMCHCLSLLNFDVSASVLSGSLSGGKLLNLLNLLFHCSLFQVAFSMVVLSVWISFFYNIVCCCIIE